MYVQFAQEDVGLSSLAVKTNELLTNAHNK